ncbi:MAG: efflux RND transporter periplasmic adaptor subunit [Phycisphaerae bacterium]|nr:efflux RND transporter periplasmic adaptor subunit [Phycisphaerae bacterium]
MNTITAILTTCVLVAAGGPSVPPKPTSPPTASAHTAFPAVTKPIHDLELGFPTSGRIESMQAKIGDAVAAGAIIAELENSDIEAQIALAQLRASNQASVDAARSERDLAKEILARIETAHADGGANPKELLDARTKLVRAEADLVKAEQLLQEARLEEREHQARLERTRLVAPFAGTIEDVRVEAGGAIDELAAVVRLVDTSTLRVDVAVPVEMANAISVNDRFAIRYRDLEMGARERIGRVTSLARVADAGSRMRVIRLEMPNPEGHPAGVPVEVDLTSVPAVATGAER